MVKTMLHPTWSGKLAAQKPIESSLAGNIGWARLVEQLRLSGEIKPTEDIEALVLTDDGIQYFLKRK